MQDDIAATSEHSRSTFDDSPLTVKCVKQLTVQSHDGNWTNVDLKDKITEMQRIFKSTRNVQMDSVLDEALHPIKRYNSFNSGLRLFSVKESRNSSNKKVISDLSSDLKRPSPFFITPTTVI